MKNWYQSKTIWLAIVQAAIALVMVFSDANPTVAGWIMAKSVLDILLRYITSGSIER